jgi:hypothetical protein
MIADTFVAVKMPANCADTFTRRRLLSGKNPIKTRRAATPDAMSRERGVSLKEVR